MIKGIGVHMPKVLVVDDSISVRKALERVLAPREMEVTAAASGQEALEHLRRSVPDLVIIDVVMPGMSGFELCSSLKKDEHLKHIPVILISGLVNPSVIAQAIEVGALSVVSKPFTPDELFPKIDAALNSLSALHLNEPNAPAASAPAMRNAGSSSLDVPVFSTPAPVAPVPAAPTASKALESLLEPFLDKPEVETVALVHRNGTVMAISGKALTDAALFGTFARTIASISGVLGEHLEIGALGGVSLEYQRRNVLLTGVNDTVVLAVLLEGNTSVVKYIAQRQIPQIRSMLEVN
jgi:CheY-like chemotaxis protein